MAVTPWSVTGKWAGADAMAQVAAGGRDLEREIAVRREERAL